jgi:hypothetical protein
MSEISWCSFVSINFVSFYFGPFRFVFVNFVSFRSVSHISFRVSFRILQVPDLTQHFNRALNLKRRKRITLRGFQNGPIEE